MGAFSHLWGDVEFFLAAKPTTKGNHSTIIRGRGGRPTLIPSSAARKAQAELVALLLRHRPRRPLMGPVRLDVDFVLAVPKSFTQAEREAAHAGRLFPAEAHNGDRGNFLKLLEDALQGARFVVNDAQICAGEVRKRFASAEDPRAGYQVRLQAIEGAR